MKAVPISTVKFSFSIIHISLHPNGDTYNDTWNIWDLKDQPVDGVFIFDRYGKFIKQISPQGTGWDGTMNGYELPASDYWFTVDYVDPNTNTSHVFKSHFSLKR